ncbi:MAG: 3-oxoacyl-[acyl-carrier-protein] synthase 2 [Candidatus Hydrogenedentota bacterium]
MRRIERFDPTPFPCKIAGEVRDYDPSEFMKKADVRRWYRHVHLAAGSARLALDDSSYVPGTYDPERMATAFGTSVGSPDEHYLRHRTSYETGGWTNLDKLTTSASSGHGATAYISVTHGLRGPAVTLASGCSTGLDVVSWGVAQIRSGRADMAVVGATEAPLTELTIAASCALGILSKMNDAPEKAMRPFDRNSDGIVLSEGSAALVLERLGHARERGATILAEVGGYGSSAEANNLLTLEREGAALARAMSTAIQDAGTSPEDIDAAFCHGVSLPMYDRSETAAYKKALAKQAYRIPLSATKSMTGQPYSAGGLYSIGAALLAIQEGIVAPNINLQDPDPECDLDYVPKKARYNDVRTAIVTAMSFGGTHGALVLRKCN